LYITVFSLVLELGDALRISEGRDREQTGNGVQHETPASSVRTSPFSHAQQLTLEFATLPGSLLLTGVSLKNSCFVKIAGIWETENACQNGDRRL
jgi:hypothetical protein